MFDPVCSARNFQEPNENSSGTLTEMKNAQGTSARTFHITYLSGVQFVFSGQEIDELRQMCEPFCKRKVVTMFFFQRSNHPHNLERDNLSTGCGPQPNLTY